MAPTTTLPTSSKSIQQKQQDKVKNRQSKEHIQRVRAREKELRRGEGGKKAKFFWGSPGQTYEINVHGPEGV